MITNVDQARSVVIDNNPSLFNRTEEMPQHLNQIIQSEQQEGFNSKLNDITDFVEAVRIQQHLEDAERGNFRMRTDTAALELQEVQQKAEKSIIDAERFKALVEQPGNVTSIPPISFGNAQLSNVNGLGNAMNDKNDEGDSLNLLDIGSGVSDDDFFYLTCHIEPNLIHKIEKGEFVELEKLLPKEKLGGKSEESRLEWVQHDGGIFLVPAQRDNKIGSFRRWEQAFRAYATIYCGANPHRSKEIWQYITVINTAASSYVWENVYNYDITFRHLMAFNPTRSWAVTYNQMWNLSMKEPLPKQYGRSGYAAFNHSSGSGYVQSSKGNGSGNGSMQVRQNKSDYCWNFNKGVPCKFGNKCKFIERCKYCDSPSHGVNACQKLLRKEGSKLGQFGQAGQGNAHNNNNNNNNNASK